MFIDPQGKKQTKIKEKEEKEKEEKLFPPNKKK